jgi:hypothetical protein
VRALPVQSAQDRIEHDPQLRHREMYLECNPTLRPKFEDYSSGDVAQY